jgi:hypothetical protein
VAIAAGQPVGGWAKANEIPKRTAYRWSRDPEVRRLVAEIRRRSIDKAVGRLSKAAEAADQIIKLAREAAAEAVRLTAARSILSDLMAVSDHQQLDARIAELERRILEKPDVAGDAGQEPTAP